MMRQGRMPTTDCSLQTTHWSRGSTLLDAVVGTALMLVVFVGIVGAFRLTVMVVSNNKARAGAIALSNERLEFIRSLPYNSVGTVGGIPSGTIAQTETVSLNDVNYTRRTFISYEDDPVDGLGAADTNNIRTDFKAAKVTVSWTVRDGTHTITLISRVSPPGVETSVPGGTLSFTVNNATLSPVSNAQIRIVNSGVSPAVDLTTYTDAAGTASILGVPAGSGYQITVTKSGYSTAQTYSSSATNTNPIPTHLGVALNQTTAATFAIDTLATKIIETFTPVTRATTTESFSDSSGVSSVASTTVAGGVVQLISTDGVYPPEGTLTTVSVSTSSLVAWKTLSFVDTTPGGTDVRYRIFDTNGTLIPDAQLAGNSTGFTNSPVDLSGISTSTYGSLVTHATLSTSDPSLTPTLDSYSIALDRGPIPFPNVGLSMRGAKTIGTTSGGAQVYKYNITTLSTNALGSLTLSGIEWDTYTVSLNASTTYVISSACNPQPEALSPNTTQTTQLFISPFTTHTLLVDVKNASGVVVPHASVRLYRTAPAYDTTIASDTCGQSFFSGLSSGTSGGGNIYSLQVSASGYTTFTSTSVTVSGTSQVSVVLNN